jgi:hypothetical protein
MIYFSYTIQTMVSIYKYIAVAMFSMVVSVDGLSFQCIQSSSVDQFHFVNVAREGQNVVCAGNPEKAACDWYDQKCDPFPATVGVYCETGPEAPVWCQLAAIHLGLARAVPWDQDKLGKSETKAKPLVEGDWIQGRATYYDTDDPSQNHGFVNMGSCDNRIDNWDNVVALNEHDYDVNGQGVQWCYSKQCIEIMDIASGRTARSIIADRCAGCAKGQLDFTRGSLNALGRSTGDGGVFQVQWRLC